jgi:alpha-beta hydrolase superfamily lysophospholipase
MAHSSSDVECPKRKTWFLYEQSPNQTVFLLGQSMGGLVVLEYVLHNPEGLAGVIASAPALGVDIPPFLMMSSLEKG